MLEQNKNDHNLVQEIKATCPDTQELIGMLITAIDDESGKTPEDW